MSNHLSELSAWVNISVVLPVPTDLLLTLMVPDNKHDLLPSCVPVDLDLGTPNLLEDNQKTIEVFTGESVKLEADVAQGINLTFDWSFSDGGNYAVSPYLTQCEGLACTSNIKVNINILIKMFYLETHPWFCSGLCSNKDMGLSMLSVARSYSSIAFFM